MSRIKGQETQVIFSGPAGQEEAFTAVQSWEGEIQLEILSEGYIGEKTNRRDEIFNGMRGRCEVHLEDASYFAFAQRVKDRAQRRAPAAGQFNVVTTYTFPDGDRARVLHEDVHFGALPTSAGGRGEYVTATIEWECADGRFLF
ncbi:MAG: hypothetical protein ACODAG_09365 [Myxococcota bacterium]